MSQVKISKKVLVQQVEDGMKKDQLAEFYGIPVSQMTKVLQSAGLRIRKFHRPAFELVDDLEEEETTEVAPESIQEVVTETIAEEVEVQHEEVVNATPEVAPEHQVNAVDYPVFTDTMPENGSDNLWK